MARRKRPKIPGERNIGLYVGVGLIVAAVAAIIVIIGFGGGGGDSPILDIADPDTTTTTEAPDDEEDGGARIPPGEGDCSAAAFPGGELVDQDSLPGPIANVRVAVTEAAARCDLERLEELMGSGFVWGFAADETGAEGAIADWTAREEAGEPVLLRLLEIAALDFDIADDGTYTFPAAAQWRGEEWTEATPEQLAALAEVYGQEAVDDWVATGTFDGFRFGVRNTGEWYYFVGAVL